MSRVRYVDKRFYAKKAALLPHVQAIIAEYAAQGFVLNPRAVAYRLEGKGKIVKTVETFQLVEDVVKEGREMGLIDWDRVAIDAQRALHEWAAWKSTKDRLLHAAKTHRLDKWARQSKRVEVWVEKEGLLGVIGDVCTEEDVPYRTVTGYDGLRPKRDGARRIMARTAFGRVLTRLHDAGVWRDDTAITAEELEALLTDQAIADSDLAAWARRVREMLEDEQVKGETDQSTVILYVGDHDPSGVDLQRDIEEKLRLYGATGFRVVRVAVTCEETCLTAQSDLHSNPAKEQDPRYGGYEQEHATAEAWEVEAIEPADLVTRLREAIEEHRDEELWREAVAEEERQREELQRLAENVEEDE